MTFGSFGGGGGNEVRVRIVGDKSDLDKNLKGATRDVDQFESKTKKSMGGISTAAKAALVAGAGVAVARFAGDAINQAEAMQSAYAATAQIIESTGGVAGVTAEHIKELSKQEAQATGTSKDLVTEGNNILLTFKNIGDEIFDRTSGIMLDIAAVMGTDAKSGAVQLGKALNDPITGISTLTRVGVTFNDEQKEQIRLMTEAGDVAGAQTVILNELETEFGGVAEATADTSAQIGVAMDEIKEAIGTKLLGPLQLVYQELVRVQDPLSAFEIQTGQAKGTAVNLAGALNELAREANIQHGKIDKSGDGLARWEREARKLIDAAGLSTDELGKLRDGLPILRDEFDLTNEQAERLEELLGKQIVVSADNLRETFEQNMSPAAGEFATILQNLAKGGQASRQAFEDNIGPAEDLTEHWYDMYDAVYLLNGELGTLDQRLRAYLDHQDFLRRGSDLPSLPDNGELPQYASGGIVSGPKGAPQLAVVHGGEAVIPSDQMDATGTALSSGYGGVINLTMVFQGFVGSELAVAAEIDRLLTRRGRYAKLNLLG